jgi:hypothetical protein
MLGWLGCRAGQIRQLTAERLEAGDIGAFGGRTQAGEVRRG